MYELFDKKYFNVPVSSEIELPMANSNVLWLRVIAKPRDIPEKDGEWYAQVMVIPHGPQVDVVTFDGQCRLVSPPEYLAEEIGKSGARFFQ